MTFAENIAQIKDIVVTVFLLFSFVVVAYVTVTLMRLHSRMNRFMDRMEKVADGFEETFATKGTLVMSLLQYSFPKTLFQAQNGTFRKP